MEICCLKKCKAYVKITMLGQHSHCKYTVLRITLVFFECAILIVYLRTNISSSAKLKNNFWYHTIFDFAYMTTKHETDVDENALATADAVVDTRGTASGHRVVHYSQKVRETLRLWQRTNQVHMHLIKTLPCVGMGCTPLPSLSPICEGPTKRT